MLTAIAGIGVRCGVSSSARDPQAIAREDFVAPIGHCAQYRQPRETDQFAVTEGAVDLSKGVGSADPFSIRATDMHLGHQGVARRTVLRCAKIGGRDVEQPELLVFVLAANEVDLAAAEGAVAVVEDFQLSRLLLRLLIWRLLVWRA